jgi:hypothetical protein
MRKTVLLVSVSTFVLFTSACASSSSGPDSATPQAPPPAASAQIHANLAQLMRGVLFPNSNVIFAAQGTNPAEVKQASDPSTATDPIASAYGGWMAIENSGLALAESANLLMVPGRTCQNGKPVPIQSADWAPFVQELRDAGMTSYKAAQSKNQDSILDAADKVTTACMKCHDRYREKPDAERCM